MSGGQDMVLIHSLHRMSCSDALLQAAYCISRHNIILLTVLANNVLLVQCRQLRLVKYTLVK